MYVYMYMYVCMYVCVYIGPLILTLTSPTDTSYFDCFEDSTEGIPVFDGPPAAHTHGRDREHKSQGDSSGGGSGSDVVGGYECTDFTSFSFNNIN